MFVLFGGVACSAEAQSGTPTPGATSATPTGSRQPIEVTLTPSRITAGAGAGGANKTIHILALCPLPQGGTLYTASATSKAFTGSVTLAPAPPATQTASTPPPSTPELRGTAFLSATAKVGTYNVTVRCEATNDTGTATLTVLARPRSTPTPSRTSTRIPTSAPHAGGGGTAAGGPAEDSGLPLPVTVLALAVALGVGVAVARRARG